MGVNEGETVSEAQFLVAAWVHWVLTVSAWHVVDMVVVEWDGGPNASSA